jgi:hypothetical protein
MCLPNKLSLSLRSTGTNSPAYISPTFSSVKVMVDGLETDITSTWESAGCSTGVDEFGSNFTSACVFGTAIIEGDIICRNAILSIEYTVYHAQDAYSTITSVSVDVVVGDVTYDAVSTSTNFLQSYGVKFSDTATATAVTQTNGNQVAR